MRAVSTAREVSWVGGGPTVGIQIGRFTCVVLLVRVRVRLPAIAAFRPLLVIRVEFILVPVNATLGLGQRLAVKMSPASLPGRRLAAILEGMLGQRLGLGQATVGGSDLVATGTSPSET